jgi:hypothetical protein
MLACFTRQGVCTRHQGLNDAAQYVMAASIDETCLGLLLQSYP